MDIYTLENIKINAIIRVFSEGKNNERVYFSKNLYSHELIICLSGRNDVGFNNIKMIDEPGYIRFFPKGIYSHDYYVDIKEQGECIDIFFDSDTIIPQKPFNKNYSKNPRIVDLFIKIHKTWIKKDIGYYNKCMSLIYSILSEMEETDSVYLTTGQKNKLNSSMDYIHQHYRDNNFQYGLLPQLCGISYTHFKNLFIKNYNCLPSEYVIHLKNQYACELLATNRFSITQIAEQCGFNDIAYFSRQFKKYYGVSPSKYNQN